jgi:hypothetical protein
LLNTSGSFKEKIVKKRVELDAGSGYSKKPLVAIASGLPLEVF